MDGNPLRADLLSTHQLLKIGIFLTEAAKVHNSFHRAPGGSWVAGIPTR